MSRILGMLEAVGYGMSQRTILVSTGFRTGSNALRSFALQLRIAWRSAVSLIILEHHDVNLEVVSSLPSCSVRWLCYAAKTSIDPPYDFELLIFFRLSSQIQS